jgi:hypothetical protein
MRKNLSQQKLLEILCSEMEILQQTSKNFKEVAPEIAKQLNKLKTTGVSATINTKRLEWLLANHEKQIKKSVVIPRWFFGMVVFVIVWLVVQGIWLYL